MASVNKAILVGALGKDPEMKHMASGDAVTKVSIATSESWKDKSSGERKEVTEWHNVVFYKKLAEIVAQYARKGSQLYVEGIIRTRKWKDKEGNDRYTTEIEGREMQLIGNKPAAAKKDNEKSSRTSNDEDDDIPF